MDLCAMTILQVGSPVRVPMAKGSTFEMKNRPSSALMLMEKGSVEYLCAGGRFLSDETHVLLVPQGLSYSLRFLEDGVSPVINFQMAETPDGIESFDVDGSQDLVRIFGKMEKLWIFRKETGRLGLMQNLYEIFARIDDQRHARVAEPRVNPIIRRSVEYMERHFTDPDINNDVLAQQSSVSTVYFRKLFAEQFGVSPMKYIRAKRIEKAQDLLRTRQVSITDIAGMTGYGSIFHFSRIFHATTGYSPSEWVNRFGE